MIYLSARISQPKSSTSNIKMALLRHSADAVEVCTLSLGLAYNPTWYIVVHLYPALNIVLARIEFAGWLYRRDIHRHHHKQYSLSTTTDRASLESPLGRHHILVKFLLEHR